MPFTNQDRIARQQALIKKAAEEEREKAKAAAEERGRSELRTRLESTYPEIPLHDAESLWKIVTLLTDDLLRQYRAGKPKIEAKTHTWRNLFVNERLNVNLMQVDYIEKPYVEVLQRMATEYNDIGQVFSTVDVNPHELRERYRDRRVWVICTIPLND